MAKKIYVGNMSYSTKEDQLKEIFSEFGEVISAKVVFDRETKRHKGFGFVEMATEEGAENAISSLDGKEVAGRMLKVNEAIEKTRF